MDDLNIKYYDNETQNDRWVLDVLNGKKNGFFIEAGAYNGTSASCTCTLERFLGWRGILVEPIDEFQPGLIKNRPNSIIINKLLSNVHSTERFIYLPDRPALSCSEDAYIIPENNKKIARIHKDKNGKTDYPVKKIWKECVPLEYLLEKYNSPKIIDYLALDIEGSEYKVLHNFPFDKYKIRCITIEGQKCDNLLTSKGYKKVVNKFNKTAPWESYFVYLDEIPSR